MQVCPSIEVSLILNVPDILRRSHGQDDGFEFRNAELNGIIRYNAVLLIGDVRAETFLTAIALDQRPTLSEALLSLSAFPYITRSATMGTRISVFGKVIDKC